MADDFAEGNLRRLSDADLAIAENEPDVRGWTVVSSDGTELGEVEDLIVDVSAMKVRYLELDADDTVAEVSDEPIYIPIATAEIDRGRKRVVVPGDSITSLRSHVPAGFGQQFSRRRAATDVGARGTGDTGEVRRMTRAEEEVRVAKQAVQKGEVRVGKHVETEHRHDEVTVTREDVHIERRPVTDPNAPAEIRASADEIRVPIVEEQVVVEKRPVVKEELIVTKEQVQEARPVDVEVRKEEFDIRDDRTERVSDSPSTDARVRREGRR